MAGQDDAALYFGVVDRIDEVVADGLQLDRRVRACPDWTIRQLLGHITGIAEDWVTGRFQGYASEAWTNEQVDRHAGRSWADLRVCWRAALDELPSAPPHPQLGAPWRWLFGDALCHEADLRETTDDGRRPPSDAVVVGLGQVMGRWRQALHDREDGLVVTATGVRTWEIGNVGVRPAHVESDPYELWRAVSGRRAIEDIDRYDWSDGRASDWFLTLPLPFRAPSGAVPAESGGPPLGE